MVISKKIKKRVYFIWIVIAILIGCKEESINNPIVPNKNILSDYFPLSIGNWWVFEYKNYKPNQNADAWLSGKMKWEITSFAKNGNDKIYFYDEIIDGIVVLGNPINSDLDTTVISNQIRKLKFIEQENWFVDIGKGGYFSDHLNIKIKRFYSGKSSNIILFNSCNDDTTDIIHDYYTSQKIKLQKNVGITEWNIDNCSNSSPDGDLVLSVPSKAIIIKLDNPAQKKISHQLKLSYT